jgi:hypothetical protein
LGVQAIYGLQGTYTDPQGKKFETGRIIRAWASHPMYCGPDSPLNYGDPCTSSIWKWDTRADGCQDLTIFDEKDTKTPLLKISRMCKMPVVFYPCPNTTWYFPRDSAVRLFVMAILSYQIDGYNSDGTPKVLNHTLYDFDMEAIATPATYDTMEGTAVSQFSQYLIPLGFNILPGGSIRTGVTFISPYQQSF